MKVIDVDFLPADPLEALRALSRADVELEALRREQVEVARSQGATWDQICESLGMSRQSAWEYYTRETRRVLDEVVAGSELGEDEAMRIATEEVSGCGGDAGPRVPERFGCEWCSMPTC